MLSSNTPEMQGYAGMGEDHQVPEGLMDDDNYGDDEDEEEEDDGGI